MPEESMYPDSGEDEESPEPSPDKSESKDDKKDEKDTKEEGHTELVSKKLLDLDEDEEVEEGRECTFRVKKDWGDSVEIEYVSKKKDKKSPKKETSADDELDDIEESSMKGKSYAGM